MSDPRRLIDTAESPEARLLASALHEPPPADLLARTLTAVGAAGAGAAVGAGAAGKATGVVVGKAAGGGILGAVAAGALAGIVAVGGYGLLAPRDAPPPSPPPAITASPLAPPPPLPRSPAPAPAPTTPAATAPSAPPPASAARPSALSIEIELLDDATRALHAGDRAQAKTLLDRYAREVPHGQLAREAAALRAELADAGTIP